MVKWIIDMALGGPRRGGEGLGGKVIWVVCIVLAELKTWFQVFHTLDYDTGLLSQSYVARTDV